jgi:hypothetical protein
MMATPTNIFSCLEEELAAGVLRVWREAGVLIEELDEQTRKEVLLNGVCTIAEGGQGDEKRGTPPPV